MDAPSQVSQLAQRDRELVAHLLECASEGRVGRERRPGSHGPELECHGHQALLRAVVKVSLDSPPLGVRGLDDPSPRGSDLLQLLNGGSWIPQMVLTHPMLGAMDYAEQPAADPSELDASVTAGLEDLSDEAIRHFGEQYERVES